MTKGSTMAIQMVSLKDIEANPYRNSDEYKLSEDKIAALTQSYENAGGFWDGSIQARPHPTKPGKVQIAFGHHRVEAAKRAGLKTIGLVVGPRDNATMLRMMASENQEEFRSDALLTVETISAVVDAYGRGEIDLEAVDPKTNKAQVHAFPNGKAYSLPTIARFLGWIKPSTGQATHACRSAFDAYRQLASTKEALASIPSAQRSDVAVQTVTTAANAARHHAEKANLPPAATRKAEKMAAWAAAKDVVENTGFKARETASEHGKQAVAAIKEKKARKPIPVEFYLTRLKHKLAALDSPYRGIISDFSVLIPLLNDIDPTERRALAKAIRETIIRTTNPFLDIAKALDTNQLGQIRKLLEAAK